LKGIQQSKDKIINSAISKGNEPNPKFLKAANPKDHLNVLSTLCNKRDVIPDFCEAMGKATDEYKKRMTFWMNDTKLDQIETAQTESIFKFQKVRDVVDSDKLNLQEKLVVALYSAFTIRDDYGNVTLLTRRGAVPDEESNKSYYNTKDHKFYLQNYKTHNKYGNKMYLMLKQVWALVNEIIQQDPERKYLIEKSKGKIFGKNGKLSSYIGDIFKKTGEFTQTVKVNDLRHSRVAELYSKKKATNANKIKLASDMCHEVSTAVMIYDRKGINDNQDI
jgi:hypothetical protein